MLLLALSSWCSLRFRSLPISFESILCAVTAAGFCGSESLSDECIANGCDYTDDHCRHNDYTRGKYLTELQDPQIAGIGTNKLEQFFFYVPGSLCPGYVLAKALLKIGLRKGVLLQNFQQFFYALIATNGG